MAPTTPLAFHQYFFNLEDPRRVSHTDYRFLDLVFIAVAATIAGADDFHQIETFARKRRAWLEKFCHLPKDGNLSHDTFERLFKRLEPHAFARCFARWMQALAKELGLKQIAIDGKTLCGSGRRSAGLRALHLVSAWATENKLSLGQVAVDDKSNEITAIPALLELLELKGALVTIDAMGCQKEIAAKIVDGGGDYVLPVKGNQERLLRDIELSFAAATALDFEGLCYDLYTTQDKGHGRVETRTYILLRQLGLIRDKDKWKNLTTIGMCIYERQINGQLSSEEHYFIGSRKMDAKGYGDALRAHWGVENGLHWQLDVTFAEDANRVAERHAAQNLAVIRRLVVSLLKRHPSKKSMANKRYAAALDETVLEEILNLQ
jgi:predicted transposase YbfD/YdcC